MLETEMRDGMEEGIGTGPLEMGSEPNDGYVPLPCASLGALIYTNQSCTGFVRCSPRTNVTCGLMSTL